VLVGGFAAAILVGALLLTLPLASAGARIGLLDALFTATSAVCVTGLTVRDTGREFSTFGHVVILALIQLGGLGITTRRSSCRLNWTACRCSGRYGTRVFTPSVPSATPGSPCGPITSWATGPIRP
jgi:Trk-type K+ transport system membrane component